MKTIKVVAAVIQRQKNDKKEMRPLNRKALISRLQKTYEDDFWQTIRDSVHLRNEMAPMNSYQERAFTFTEHLLQSSYESELCRLNEELKKLDLKMEGNHDGN